MQEMGPGIAGTLPETRKSQSKLHSGTQPTTMSRSWRQNSVCHCGLRVQAVGAKNACYEHMWLTKLLLRGKGDSENRGAQAAKDVFRGTSDNNSMENSR